MSDFKLPEELKYSKDHEWVKVEEDIVTVGVSDYAQQQLTDVVFVELPEGGREVSLGKSICSIESVKSVSDIFSPVSGEIIEVNKELENKPELINKDPYGEGWIVKIKFKDVADIEKLMSASEYKNLISG